MVISTMIAVWVYAVAMLSGIMVLAGFASLMSDEIDPKNFRWDKFLLMIFLLIAAISVIAGMGWY